MDILDKAKELGELIGASEEMAKLKKSEQALESDQKSIALLSDFKKLQTEMMNAMEGNEDKLLIASIKGKLLSKQEEINNYAVTKEYLETKSAFDGMMKQINDVIVFGITGEEPSSCSHSDCSSCGCGCE